MLTSHYVVDIRSLIKFIYSVWKVTVEMSVLGQTGLCSLVPSFPQWPIVGAYEKLVRHLN